VLQSLKWLMHRTHLDEYPLLISLIGGSLVGLCGVLVPSVLFWGEHELQWAVVFILPLVRDIYHTMRYSYSHGGLSIRLRFSNSNSNHSTPLRSLFSTPLLFSTLLH
jgi:hypothetical protein